MKRIPLSTWFHLIEAKLPSGEARVVATLCTRAATEKMKETMETRYSSSSHVYTITTAPVYEINRRCDICVCKK
jgi:hypothetical protein